MPIPDCTRFQQTDTFAETPRAITYYQTRFFAPTGGPPILAIASITVLSPTSMRVFFNETVTDNPALRMLSLYRTTPTLRILAIAVDAGSPDPISVVLTTSEMMQGGAYTLFIDRLDSTIDADATLSGAFTGLGTAPQVVSATPLTRSSARLLFNEPMGGASLTSPASYTLNAVGMATPRTVTGVTQDPTNTSAVILQFSGFLDPGLNNYTVVAGAGATDAAGNPVDVAHNSAPLSGQQTHATPFIASHCQVAQSKLSAQFQNSTRLMALVCVFANRDQEIEQAIADVLAYRAISSGFGATLDNLGTILDQKRAGLQDEVYRVRLQARALVISSGGHADELLHILQVLDNGFAPAAIHLIETTSMVTILTAQVPNGQVRLGFAFIRILRRAKASGTRLMLEFRQLGVNRFRMMNVGTPVPAGFGMTNVGGAVNGYMDEVVS